MNSTKRLRSVCHSIAHHSVSGLSYVHPYIRASCRLAQTNNVEISLVNIFQVPQLFKNNKPLLLAIEALEKWIKMLLHSEGLFEKEIDCVKLHFYFPENIPDDDYCSNCRATIITITGKEITKTVNYVGKEIPNKRIMEKFPLVEKINSIFPKKPK